MNILGIIPARYQSTRFPGKPLVKINGKPMIQWVYEGCSGVFNELAVATDDRRIYEAVSNFGGNAVMTSPDHLSGTDRCAEAAMILETRSNTKFTHVINIQGDEPLVKRVQLERLIQDLEDESTDIATLAIAMKPDEDKENPNIVKVVVNHTGKAMYFSRSAIPYNRGSVKDQRYLKHLGFYAFRSEVLQEVCKLPISVLEKAESLEQLRWLENGYQIRVGITDIPSMGVDTPEDLEQLSKLLS